MHTTNTKRKARQNKRGKRKEKRETLDLITGGWNQEDGERGEDLWEGFLLTERYRESSNRMGEGGETGELISFGGVRKSECG